MNNQKGFTLIELIVTMLVASIILAAIYSLFTVQDRSYASQVLAIEMNANARMAGMVTDDIRMAGLGQKAGFKGISSAKVDEITVSMDIDGDGSDSGSNEKITYHYDSILQQLLRREEAIKEEQPLMDNVTSFFITYKMSNGTITSNPADLSDIREVKIAMTIQTQRIDPLTNKYKNQSINLCITPRNMAF